MTLYEYFGGKIKIHSNNQVMRMFACAHAKHPHGPRAHSEHELPADSLVEDTNET
jgi:hypothetical protein